MKSSTFLAFCTSLLLLSCQSQEWQKVRIEPKTCPSLGTECLTNHQGEHELTDCRVFVENDTLVILFPAGLPAYWGSAEVKIHNGAFSARFDGVPFQLVEISFETCKQQLSLNKEHYAIGDTLCGYCDFAFRETYPETNEIFDFYVRGHISEIVRSENFNLFDETDFDNISSE